jgi:hypothetical protein
MRPPQRGKQRGRPISQFGRAGHRSLTSRPAMPASGSSGARGARRSTIRLFQDSRCARMRRCNSQTGVSRSPTPHVCSICSVVRHARASCRRWPRLQRSPAISTRSAAHFLKSYQLLVQKFAADRNRQKGASPPHRVCTRWLCLHRSRRGLTSPKVLEPRRRQFRISNRVADVPMPEVILNGSYRRAAAYPAGWRRS